MTHNSKKSKTTDIMQEILTPAKLQRLVNRDYVLCYNIETNSWNSNSYYRHTINNQELDTARAQDFCYEMERIPEFNKNYEFVAMLTKVTRHTNYKGWGKPVKRSKCDMDGTVIVGNIIVRSKNTGKLELYCKSWIGVNVCTDMAQAAYHGAYWFADYGAEYVDFRNDLIAAHQGR